MHVHAPSPVRTTFPVSIKQFPFRRPLRVAISRRQATKTASQNRFVVLVLTKTLDPDDDRGPPAEITLLSVASISIDEGVLPAPIRIDLSSPTVSPTEVIHRFGQCGNDSSPISDVRFMQHEIQA